MGKLQWSCDLKFTKFAAKTTQESQFPTSLESFHLSSSMDTGRFECMYRLMFLLVKGLWAGHLISFPHYQIERTIPAPSDCCEKKI